MHRTQPDLSTAIWAKSSYSNPGGQDCVEWAPTLHPTLTPVRDSKSPTGPALLLPSPAWGTFVTALSQGRLSPE